MDVIIYVATVNIFLTAFAGQSSQGQTPHPSQGQTGQNGDFTVEFNRERPVCSRDGSHFLPRRGPICPRDGSCLSRTPSRRKCLCLLVFSCLIYLCVMKSGKDDVFPVLVFNCLTSLFAILTSLEARKSNELFRHKLPKPLVWALRRSLCADFWGKKAKKWPTWTFCGVFGVEEGCGLILARKSLVYVHFRALIYAAETPPPPRLSRV